MPKIRVAKSAVIKGLIDHRLEFAKILQKTFPTTLCKSTEIDWDDPSAVHQRLEESNSCVLVNEIDTNYAMIQNSCLMIGQGDVVRFFSGGIESATDHRLALTVSGYGSDNPTVKFEQDDEPIPFDVSTPLDAEMAVTALIYLNSPADVFDGDWLVHEVTENDVITSNFMKNTKRTFLEFVEHVPDMRLTDDFFASQGHQIVFADWAAR